MSEEKKVLEQLEKSILFKTEKDFDPKEYFKDREGLYVSGYFEENILSKAEVVKAGTGFSVCSSVLKERANDKKIESELPEKHLFSESEACMIIAELIEKQKKGEEGFLENTGYANLFYTENFVVRVSFSGSRWDVDTFFRFGYPWYARIRVFSPAI